MPSRIFLTPRFASKQSRVDGPSPLPGRRTRWKRRRLDGALADGIDPAKSVELTVRAAHLRSQAARSQFASALLQTLADAHGRAPLTLRLHPHRAEIRACTDDLLALILRLLDEQPVEVQGAAMTSRLLTAGASPLDRDSGERLRPAVRAAHEALDLKASDGHHLPTSAELLSAWRPALQGGNDDPDTRAAPSRETVRR
jgi:hypothetical protein